MSHTHDQDGHAHVPANDDPEILVHALESVLVEKGYVDPAVLDEIAEHFENRVGPHVGAQAVARAWCDPGYRQALLDDATSAIKQLGLVPEVGEHLIAVENTEHRHNLVVCTLCSCYPWDVLGLPPAWYKSAAYRSRAVKEPRKVLEEFGVHLSNEIDIRVWDSTAETRFLVLPQRPAGTDGWSQERLASIVTRNSMIGTGLPNPAFAPDVAARA